MCIIHITYIPKFRFYSNEERIVETVNVQILRYTYIYVDEKLSIAIHTQYIIDVAETLQK